MSTLLASYDGEFGHELFSFQGRVRHLSKDYDEVIVRTKTDMRFLYEDFATSFVQQDQQIVDYDDYINEFSFRPKGARGVNCQQDFIKYGNFLGDKYDLIIHARSKPGIQTKNLDLDFYDRLYSELQGAYRIAFMGSLENSVCPSNAEDLRGLPLKDLANILHSSRLVLGASSGPIHFSSLCATPHITWGGNLLKTFYRYTHFWNPFFTPCYVLNNYENSLDYLKRRGRNFRVKLKDVCRNKNVNLVQIENFHYPTVKELKLNVNKILNG